MGILYSLAIMVDVKVDLTTWCYIHEGMSQKGCVRRKVFDEMKGQNE